MLSRFPYEPTTAGKRAHSNEYISLTKVGRTAAFPVPAI